MTEDRSRRLAAVMFTDVVGYTAMMQEDEEAAKVVRLRHRESVEAAITAHGGELLQYLGDGSLSTFPSAVRAASAAVEIQRALRDDVPLRIGIHQGQIAFDEQGIYGDSVNVAARVMGLGTAGSVIVSDKAQAELENQLGFSTASLGQFHMKNVKHPPTIFAVEADGIAVPTRDDLLPLTESTTLYSGVTQHWPRIALAAIAIAVVSGFVLPGMSAGASFQSYVFAWATATGGLWFMFEMAEKALSEESRGRTAAWLIATDLRSAIGRIPSQFALLFDRVFGDRHLTLRCFSLSAIASIVSLAIVVGIWLSIQFPMEYDIYLGNPFSGTLSDDVLVGHAIERLEVGQFFSLSVPEELEELRERLGIGRFYLGAAASTLVLALLFNLIPDFVSLWETRLIMGWMRRGPLPVALLGDLILTTVVSSAFLFGVAWLVLGYSPGVGSNRLALDRSIAVPWLADFSQMVTFKSRVGNAELDYVIPTRRDLEWTANLRPALVNAQELDRIYFAAPNSSAIQATGVFPEGYFDEVPGDVIEPNRPANDLFLDWLDRNLIVERFDDDVQVGFLLPPLSPHLPPALFFYSAFTTSVWLWLYAASLVASRVLLRMNKGVGFLLRVTDVEKHPFRSMGFVSVIITSVLFALGLPLVLL